MSVWMIISAIEFAVIIALLRYLYKFSMKIIETEDVVNEAIDVLEEKYKKMSQVLDRPVFFDSVEVRQVISDIYDCQRSIYKIAIKIGNLEEDEEKELDGGKKED